MKKYFKNCSAILLKNNELINSKFNVLVNNKNIEFLGEKYCSSYDEIVKKENVVLIPKFNYFNVKNRNNKINGVNYDFFNIENVTTESLTHQLNKFKENNVLPFLFINDIFMPTDYYDIIIPFCHKHKIKIIVKIGETLNELGLFDKLYKMSPIDFLESYGVLDQEPIIFSCANLEKDDLEKLSYYNATICLNLTEDLLLGNGIPSIATMLNLNLNIVFNTNLDDVFKEMFLCYTLPKGLLNSKNVVSELDVFKMATVNFNKIVSVNNSEENKANLMLVKIDNKFNSVLKNIILLSNNNNILAN